VTTSEYLLLHVLFWLFFLLFEVAVNAEQRLKVKSRVEVGIKLAYFGLGRNDQN
jgi:hypothetical protein